MATLGSNNKTSILVGRQVPEFVRTQHELFVQFLEYYYKFLEQDGQQLYIAKSFSEYLNIDEIYGDVQREISGHIEKEDYHVILDKLYSTYMHHLPRSIIADKTLIFKHVKDFYRAKGSEKSIQFIIRALFGVESSVYLPKTDIFGASQGVWYIQKSLNVTDIEISDVDTNGDPTGFTANNDLLPLFVNHTIQGDITNAYAIVENTNIFYEGNQQVNELTISGQVRDFTNGERVYADIIVEGIPKKLRANLFSGIISNITIDNGGFGYQQGTSVPIIPNYKGAEVIINKVSSGALDYIVIESQGAGFRTNDSILITGGGLGSGATAYVQSIDNTGNVHPNSYSIVASIIDLEANTPIGNSVFSNLNSANANTTIANSVDFWEYSNTGPVKICIVSNSGTGYTSAPSLKAFANTMVHSLGILGRMEIINGGLNYVVGDTIQIDNPIGSYGTGAEAAVSSVNANGGITHVEFVQVPGNPIGGTGYNQLLLPKANVVSVYGFGANIAVTSILGDGDKLFSVGETAGVIKELKITSAGAGYYEPPYLNFSAIPVGFGAQASATIVSGVYSYPGRYIGDNGFISSFNFLQDKDYYQKYSYVVRAPVAFDRYRKVVDDLIHPIGTKVFADYFYDMNSVTGSFATHQATYINRLLKSNYIIDGYETVTYTVDKIVDEYQPYVVAGEYFLNTTPLVTSYVGNNDIIEVATNGNAYRPGQNIYLQFSAAVSNVVNAMYTITGANDYFFTVSTVNGNTIHSLSLGPVKVFDPEMRIAAYGHNLEENDIVYLDFDAPGKNTMLSEGHISPFPLANGEVLRNNYRLRKVGVNYFTIEHPNVAKIAANVNNGYLNAYTKIVSVTANGHNLNEGDNTYINFKTGDLSNANNGYYTVRSIKDSNTFNITVPNFLFTNGTTNVHLSSITVNVIDHGLNSNDIVYMVIDTNMVGTYSVSVINADAISINTDYPISNNDETMAIMYMPNVTYDTATIYREDHGFVIGNTVIANFEGANISNTVYEVTDVIDANTYNIGQLNIMIGPNTIMSGEVSVGSYSGLYI